MNILFIGGTRRGYLTLKGLMESRAAVTGVISLSQDEHEVERYEKAIEALAQQYGIPHYLTRSLTDRDYVRVLAEEICPDVGFVVGCRILLPAAIYQFPKLGMLAVHDSLLPAYRGFAPINWSILNGEDHVGVTLFYLSEGMDEGDVAAQRRIAVSPGETASEVYERVCRETVTLVLGACTQLTNGTLPRFSQHGHAGSYTCSRIPADGLIDWQLPTGAIHNSVRALSFPYPGAFTYYTGEKLFIWKAIPVDQPRTYVGRIPGRIVATSRVDGYADVLTGDGILRLSEVQLQGRERTAAANVIKSIKVTLGLSLPDVVERMRQLELKIDNLTRDPLVRAAATETDGRV